MLSKRKIDPSSTALFSASILEMVCELDVNKMTKSIHHRVRELVAKLKNKNRKKFKPSSSKKYLESAIQKSLEVREISKELESLGEKLSKLHDKIVQPDIKNAIHLAKSSAKSALESIKVNKQALKKFDD